jgi:hypothetical protein
MNTAALNAASRAVGEVRRSLGGPAAAEALPEIFGKAGITIAPRKPPQGDFEFESTNNVVDLHPEKPSGES